MNTNDIISLAGGPLNEFEQRLANFMLQSILSDKSLTNSTQFKQAIDDSAKNFPPRFCTEAEFEINLKAYKDRIRNLRLED